MLQAVTGGIGGMLRGLLRGVRSVFKDPDDVALQRSLRETVETLKGSVGTLTGSVNALTGKNAALHDSFNLILQSLSTQNAATREGRRHQVATEERLAALESDTSSKHANVDQRLIATEQRISGLTNQIQCEQIPQLQSRVEQVEKRGEFIRREMMFELISRQGTPGSASPASLDPRIVDEAKFEAAKDNMRVNLGCGHLPLDGYINVDTRELPGIDVVSDVKNMPFEKNSLAEIHSAHMLEHFPLEELRRVLLPYWVSLLRPGGRFRAVVPDADSMILAYVSGGMTFEELREVTFGLQEYVGDQHYTMFSQDSLCELLRAGGLSDVRVTAAGRRNGVCYEMEIAATRSL